MRDFHVLRDVDPVMCIHDIRIFDNIYIQYIIYCVSTILYIDTYTVCVSMVYIYTCENNKCSNTYSPTLPANAAMAVSVSDPKDG